MEIKIETTVYTFKELLSVDEFLSIGLPPASLFNPNAERTNNEYLEVIRYQKRMLTALCVSPATPNYWGAIDVSTFNTIVTQRKFLWKMNRRGK